MLLIMNLNLTEILLNFTYMILFSLNIYFYKNSSYMLLNEIYEYHHCYLHQLGLLFVNGFYCNQQDIRSIYEFEIRWVFYMDLHGEYIQCFQFHTSMTFFYIALDIIYIFIAIGTSSYIFKQSRKSQDAHVGTKIKPKKLSLWKALKFSKFYIFCFFSCFNCTFD